MRLSFPSLPYSHPLLSSGEFRPHAQFDAEYLRKSLGGGDSAYVGIAALPSGVHSLKQGNQEAFFCYSVRSPTAYGNIDTQAVGRSFGHRMKANTHRRMMLTRGINTSSDNAPA